jgi:peptide/nickel transport system substrate-binding protein
MKLRISLFIILIFTLTLSACGLPNTGGFEPTASPSTEVTSLPEATATPGPRTLTVCLGEEPNTLYPFGGPNAAARSVLSAVYDGPVDAVGYDYQPVILTQLPSLENGDAQINAVPISVGKEVVDADGNLVLLATGMKVRPAGCHSSDCVITYDGTTPLNVDQMVVTFRMRPDLTWSDGTPITSDDSVYAYELASDASSVGSTFVLDRTDNYEAVDSNTVQWWGKPGFVDSTYFTNFWAPAPKHQWSQFSPSALQTTDLAYRTPMGWGPYILQDWLPADHITLTKNPNYYLATEGYPKFETLIFRFIADPNSAISELTAGRCDVLDPTVRLDSQTALLQQMQASGALKAYYAPGMTIEWLGLGIVPAAYDDGYDTLYAHDRADFLSDVRTRQAIAFCTDRQKLVDTVLFGLTSVPNSFLPTSHPLYNASAAIYPFDPAAGLALLNEVGWRDSDNNPATPLQAFTVKNIPASTPLILNYYTTTATQRRQVVEILSQSLAQCGIGLNVQYFSQEDLYTSGPQGLLFGRRFDLIEYAMNVDSIEPPCDWFITSQIPTAKNRWIGTNVTGYSNTAYDAACATARNSMPDDAAYKESYRQTQLLFATDLPAIPLYYRLRVAASRPDLCHFDLDPSASPLWNIEAFDYGAACGN